MTVQLPVVHRKIIGIMMRSAREKAHRTVKEVAQRLGVTPARIRQYELGTRDITLPELENLVLFLKAPLSYFLSGELGPEELPMTLPPTKEEIAARRRLIGDKLRQAREAASKSKENCANVIARKPSAIGRYERGASDIPITELDLLARYLNVDLFYFLSDGATGKESSDALDIEKLARLPRDARAFVLDPNNLPLMRVAMKFRELPIDKLKELGEVLLVVR